MTYSIRLASCEELPSIQDIEDDAAQLFINTAYPFIVTADPTPLDLLRQQCEKGLVLAAANSDDTPVGFAMALSLEGSLHLQELAVRPSHGKRGIGTRLVLAVCELAKQRGYSAVTLSTFRDIAWNAPIYSRMGFVVIMESELSNNLREIRAKEASADLPIKDRVFMRFDL